MANPTTNYSWVLPTPTDLVTDLPADFDVALQGVDNTVKALNPETTLGDISYRSSTANTNTRLSIGTTGQVLSVSGGVPAWTTPASGGGMTLLSTTNFSSGGSTLSITGISQSYKDLRIEILSPVRAATGYFTYTFNSNTGSVYDYIWFQNGSAVVNLKDNQTNINGIGYMRTTDFNLVNIIEVKNYADSTTLKPWTFAGADPEYFNTAMGSFDSSTAITTFQINANGSTFTSGTVKVWGIN